MKCKRILAVDNTFAAIFGVADTLKPEVPEAIRKMRKIGLRQVMLTGDQKITANAIAKQAEIKEVITWRGKSDKKKNSLSESPLTVYRHNDTV